MDVLPSGSGRADGKLLICNSIFNVNHQMTLYALSKSILPYKFMEALHNCLMLAKNPQQSIPIVGTWTLTQDERL